MNSPNLHRPANNPVVSVTAPTHAPPQAWTDAGRGLGLYRSALALRVVSIFIIGAAAIVGRAGAPLWWLQMFVFVLPFILIGTSIGMALGAIRFSRQPPESRGQWMAKMAAVCIAFVAAADVCLVIATVFVIAQKPLPFDPTASMGTASSIMCVVGFFAMLASMRTVALHFGRSDIARSVGGVRNLCIAMIVAVAASFAALSIMGKLLILVVVFVAFAVSIVALQRFLRVLHQLNGHIDDFSEGLL